MAATNVFLGDYSDPHHPEGIRRIKDNSENKGENAVLLSGHDGNPAELWHVDGSIRGGDKLVVDFSPKGGPKELTGTKVPAGILWEDGNTWPSVGLFVGTYTDPHHPEGIRHITDDPDKALPNTIILKGNDGNPDEEWQVTGTTDGNKVVVDFSPKGGPKELSGERTAEGILWEDGNTWPEKK